MRRRIKIVLLTIGMIGGFASGVASMRCRGEWRRESFEQRVARVCVDAARAENAESAAARAANAAPPAARAVNVEAPAVRAAAPSDAAQKPEGPKPAD